MKAGKSLWQQWNERSAWTQFRHMQRVLLGVALLIFGLALKGANPATGAYAQVLLKFPAFNIQGFIQVTAVCALIIMLWWRAGFWTLFLLAAPLHFWTAFTFNGAADGAFGWQSLVIYVWAEGQVFLSLWVAMRREKGRRIWTNSGS